MRKNKLWLLAATAISVLLVGCSKMQSTAESTIVGKRINNESWQSYHTERLKERETPYTLFFKNADDTYSMYIFGSPISFYDSKDELNLIDTSLIPPTNTQYKRQGYALQTAAGDVLSYFPRKINKTEFLIETDDAKLSFHMSGVANNSRYQEDVYVDLLGREHQSVVYQIAANASLECIPTTSGIMMRVVFDTKPKTNKLVFCIDKKEGYEVLIHEKQYITITKENGNVPLAVIRHSFLSDSSGQSNFNAGISVEETSNQWMLSIELDESFLNSETTVYPIEISPKFEIFRNNIPDTALYEAKTSGPLHLSDYSVIGMQPNYGIGIQYSKFRTHYVFGTYKQNIKAASYSFVSLAQDNVSIPVSVLRLRTFWKSPTITMESRPLPYQTESTTNISVSGLYSVDISEYIRDCIHDDTQNTDDYGLLFSNTTNEGYKIIATYDNTFYQPFTRIDFYTSPWRVEPLRDINPNPGL